MWRGNKIEIALLGGWCGLSVTDLYHLPLVKKGTRVPEVQTRGDGRTLTVTGKCANFTLTVLEVRIEPESVLALPPDRGYGHTTPLSNGGKAFSIIFILVGVPLTMLFLTALVQRLMLYLTTQPIRLCQERFSYTRQQITWIHLFVLTLMVLITFFIIPSAIFSAIEAEWSFSDAFYFCFISLSTIGLGDFVPAEQSNQRLRPLYKFSVTFFLLCGLVTMLFVLNTVHAAVGLHGLTQIFYLPPAEDEEDETEGTILQPQSPAEHPSYKSILPSENR
ncbi:potassium channel subfamily K member 1-like isoform X2 [Hypanus sabinus]|uniref:potassium channel subfamily K member 1-like isoform X2 n=1 Tax=Hypanus sabinus TaxID=79690 RepID=UPI0028C4E278|nr:potassium channel subfamily K member 1-like isoform X2 [Hypanus sabinus]